MRPATRSGVGRYRRSVPFTTLGYVDNDVKPGSRLWVFLLAAAGVAVVILSWTVPEPQPSNPNPTPAQRAEQISLAQCAKQEAPAPNYGARTIGYTTCVN